MPELLSEHETFINLIVVACENSEINRYLLKIIQLPLDARVSALINLTHKLNGAPQDFIEALYFLKDEKITQQVLDLIS